jgi:hypothetical protein
MLSSCFQPSLNPWHASKARSLAVCSEPAACETARPALASKRMPLHHAGCARVCHAAGVPLVVDEAHGAHMAFLGARAGAPVPALTAGADIAVQSSHKTLSALGQARPGAVAERAAARASVWLSDGRPCVCFAAAETASKVDAVPLPPWDASRAHGGYPFTSTLSTCVGLGAACPAQLAGVPG